MVQVHVPRGVGVQIPPWAPDPQKRNPRKAGFLLPVSYRQYEHVSCTRQRMPSYTENRMITDPYHEKMIPMMHYFLTVSSDCRCCIIQAGITCHRVFPPATLFPDESDTKASHDSHHVFLRHLRSSGNGNGHPVLFSDLPAPFHPVFRHRRFHRTGSDQYAGTRHFT